MKWALREVYDLWQQHRASRVAAALAFYAIFTLPPLLFALVLLARAVLGRAHALRLLDAELLPLIGSKGAAGLNQLVHASQSNVHALPFVAGGAIVLFAVFAIFMQVQEALDDVWGIPEARRGGAREIVFLRLHVLVAVSALALLALVALFAAAAGRVAATAADALAVVAFLVVAYRYLPRGEVGWASSAIGAVVTAVVLVAGQTVMAFYFARVHPETAYGSAGSFVLVLLWVYYSTLLFLFGAVLTRVLERRVRR
jgi:membrane protein